MLVREWDEQVGSSGCCGRLGGGESEVGAGEFAHARVAMVAMGAVYRELRAELPELDLTVVDPRNTVWLLPALVRDGRARGLGWRQIARQARRATAAPAIVVDGMVVASSGVPEPAQAVRLVRAALAAAPPERAP